MRRLRSVRAVLAVALALAAASAFAQATTMEGLCRVSGIRESGEVARITEAYRQAIDSGISEDELLPFVEDILRHKLDCPQMVRVLLTAAELSRESLPYFVVFSKVREGVTKQAPPALVVEAAESKLRTLSLSRDVLKSLESSGYRVRDYQNAAIIVSSYIEKGYAPGEVVNVIYAKGLEGAGFSALMGVVEKPVEQKAR